MIIQHDPHGRYNIIEISQRFSHAHHDDIADYPLPLGVCAERMIGPPELADDFCDGQITVESLPSRRTKGAFERAAHLRRYAKCSAPRFRDEYGFNTIGGAHAEQPLARAVGRRGIVKYGWRQHGGACIELRAQIFRYIAHAIEFGLSELMDPAHDLLRSKRLLADLSKIVGKALRVEVEQVNRH